MKRRKVLTLVVLAFAALFVFQMIRACGRMMKRKTALAEEDITPVSVVAVRRSDIEEAISFAGDIRGEKEVDVYPKVPGKLIEKKKNEGDFVEENTVVALIDRDEPAMDFAPAEVKAPITGTLTRYFVDIGGGVSPQMPILNVSDVETVNIVINVVEKDIPKIRAGQPAKVLADAYPGRSFYGRVSTINQAFDRMTRTAAVKVAVDNRQHLLKPGMFASMGLVVARHERVLCVPLEAIVEEGEKKFVFTVENGLSRKKSIATGISDGKYLEIKEGLKEGESVIIAGHYNMKDNARVQMVE